MIGFIKNRFFVIAVLTAGLTPSLALAAPKDFKELIGIFIYYVQLVIPVVMGLAVLFFFWGIVKFIFAAGDETKRKEGKNIMTWGLLALFFMVSVLAIVSILGSSIFPNFRWLPSQEPTPLPQGHYST